MPYTGVPNNMVIFTDGAPNDPAAAKSAADQAKKSNITIFAIGIGSSIDQENLKQMASRDSYVIPVSSYEDLIDFNDIINSKACSVPQTSKTMKNDELKKKEKRYFKFELTCKGITIKINSSMGKVEGMSFI